MVQFEVTNIRLDWEQVGCVNIRPLDFSLVTHTGEEALPLVQVLKCDQLPLEDGGSQPAAVSTQKSASSEFMQLLTSVSQSGQPLSLLGSQDWAGYYDSFTWSLEGQVSISYWIQVPDEDDCPL